MTLGIDATCVFSATIIDQFGDSAKFLTTPKDRGVCQRYLCELLTRSCYLLWMRLGLIQELSS